MFKSDLKVRALDGALVAVTVPAFTRIDLTVHGR
jgi:hypothetical protein